MRNRILSAGLIAVLALYPLAAQQLELKLAKPAEPPALFKGLQIQHTAMAWCDFTLTTWALKTGRYAEANPVARFYVENTGLAIGILTAADIFVHAGLKAIWRDNRTLGWTLLLIFVAARGYILWHNLSLARG